jgi:hypothetical protein
METGTLVLHTAETQGSLFLSSMAEGYLGEEKLKLGSRRPARPRRPARAGLRPVPDDDRPEGRRRSTSSRSATA